MHCAYFLAASAVAFVLVPAVAPWPHAVSATSTASSQIDPAGRDGRRDPVDAVRIPLVAACIVLMRPVYAVAR
jgi:hypothetical protein